MDYITAFNAIAPQFSSDPAKPIFLTLACGRTSKTLFRSNYGLAVALRAAHMMTLSKRITGEAGPVSGKREGDLSLQFHKSSKFRDRELDMTHYGQQLQGLISEGTVMVGVTGGNDQGRNDEPYPDVGVQQIDQIPDINEAE